MKKRFPAALVDIASWARQHNATQDEARRRLIQFVIIEAIAKGLPGRLSFKGGNALRFCYDSPRGTTDIDYTALAEVPDDPCLIKQMVDGALREHSPHYGVACKVHSVRRNPPSAHATKPTYQISVGWAIPSFRQFPGFFESSAVPTATVPVEISLNDIVCETVETRLEGDGSVAVTVCALEDIVAEKLRALLQQIPRNRTRPQDVYDIARIVRSDSLDEAKVASYFIEKCKDRGVVPAKSSFIDEVRARAEVEYELRIGPIGQEFIPFDDAWLVVQDLVSRLSIPD